MIIPYFSNLINIQKANENNSSEWKIQLNMSVKFITSNDTREIRTVYVSSESEEIGSGNDIYEIVISLINSFLSNYQTEETILRNESNYIFESVDLLSYYIHKISLKRGKSYIKSPWWLSTKKATSNPINNDNKWFQCAIAVALNNQKIGNHPERILNIKLFINQYSWKGKNFPIGIKDWKKFEQNNKSIAINIFFVPQNKESVTFVYKPKYNHKR